MAFNRQMGGGTVPVLAMTYSPPSHDLPYFDGLFAAADVHRSGTVSGQEAVAFFSASNLPTDALKMIWKMADQNPTTNSLNKEKFYVAVRLVQLAQNGQEAQGATLASLPGVTMRPPFFEGISRVSVPLPLPKEGPVPQHSSHQHSDPFFMYAHEKMRYEALFPAYESKNDGFVYGPEAIALFSKSGLGQDQLRAIWAMVDDPIDNRLSKVEFAIAMHLIVCISKRRLPIPQSLPPSLKALKEEVQASQINSGGTNIDIDARPRGEQPQQHQQQQREVQTETPSTKENSNWNNCSPLENTNNMGGTGRIFSSNASSGLGVDGNELNEDGVLSHVETLRQVISNLCSENVALKEDKKASSRKDAEVAALLSQCESLRRNAEDLSCENTRLKEAESKASADLFTLESTCERLKRERDELRREVDETLCGANIASKSLVDLEAMGERLRNALSLVTVQREKAVKKVLADEEERRTCVICQVEPKTVLLMPCRHLCICENCSRKQKLDRCPLCRSIVAEQMEVYS